MSSSLHNNSENPLQRQRAALLSPTNSIRPYYGSRLTTEYSYSLGHCKTEAEDRMLMNSMADLYLNKSSLRKDTVYNADRSVIVNGVSNVTEKTL
jgi:hypothetical protein